MNFKDFNAGQFIEQYQYKSFSPNEINQSFIWDDPEINTLLENATLMLGQLNAFTKLIPNVDIFIQMHINTEANKSSKIEGTKTEIDEVIMPKDVIEPEKRDDWQEVNNYIKAIAYSIEELKRLPISNRLIKETHKILLDSVRGEHKQPGDFRISQNWIGGSNISNATFIPPHHTEVLELMSDLEKFLHNEEAKVPHLIKIALIHYQFETIHPFLDGNGRIGRLLITLYLVSNGLIDKPSLYLSDFFERNKLEYYDHLMKVRYENKIEEWVKFFLKGVIETSDKGIKTFQNIMQLKQEVDSILLSFGKKAENAGALMEYLYQRPLITISQVVELLEVTKPTANALVKDLEKCNILKEATGRQRNKLYVFDKYLSLFN